MDDSAWCAELGGGAEAAVAEAVVGWAARAHHPNFRNAHGRVIFPFAQLPLETVLRRQDCEYRERSVSDDWLGELGAIRQGNIRDAEAGG